MDLIQGNCNLFDYRVEYAGISDPGRLRRCNEDDLLLLADLGLFAVADGLGGLDAGDIASKTALAALKEFYTVLPAASSPWRSLPESGAGEIQALTTIIQAVNNRTYQQRLILGKNMATTLAMMQLCREGVAIAHVGDSRVYHLHGTELERVTRDHSLVSELVERGVLTASQAEHSPQRNVITRAIGSEPSVVPSVQQRTVLPGDLLLLCTDGLTTMLPDAGIAEIIRGQQDDIGQAATLLVQAANEAGGQDNITVILVALHRLGEGKDRNL